MSCNHPSTYSQHVIQRVCKQHPVYDTNTPQNNAIMACFRVTHSCLNNSTTPGNSIKTLHELMNLFKTTFRLFSCICCFE